MPETNKDTDRHDIVIVIGGGMGMSDYEKTLKNVRENCEAYGLKYKVVGDGKSYISQSDLENIPRAEHVVLIGHGSVQNKDDNSYHEISLTEDGNRTIDTINMLQEKTGSEKFMIASCYSGLVNHRLAEESSLKDNTEILVTASTDEPSSSLPILKAVEMMVENVCVNKLYEDKNSLRNTYAELIANIPETLGYGVQCGNDFKKTTIRREDRAVLSNVDAERYIDYNIDKFINFAKENNLPAPNIDHAKPKDVNKYYIDSFRNHLLHGDATVVDAILSNDKEMAAKFKLEKGISVGVFALDRLKGHMKSIKSLDKHWNMIMVLLKHDPNAMEEYFNNQFKLLNDDQKKNALEFLRGMAEKHEDKKLFETLEKHAPSKDVSNDQPKEEKRVPLEERTALNETKDASNEAANLVPPPTIITPGYNDKPKETSADAQANQAEQKQPEQKQPEIEKQQELQTPKPASSPSAAPPAPPPPPAAPPQQHASKKQNQPEKRKPSVSINQMPQPPVQNENAAPLPEQSHPKAQPKQPEPSADAPKQSNPVNNQTAQPEVLQPQDNKATSTMTSMPPASHPMGSRNNYHRPRSQLDPKNIQKIVDKLSSEGWSFKQVVPDNKAYYTAPLIAEKGNDSFVIDVNKFTTNSTNIETFKAMLTAFQISHPGEQPKITISNPDLMKTWQEAYKAIYDKPAPPDLIAVNSPQNPNVENTENTAPRRSR